MPLLSHSSACKHQSQGRRAFGATASFDDGELRAVWTEHMSSECRQTWHLTLWKARKVVDEFVAFLSSGRMSQQGLKLCSGLTTCFLGAKPSVMIPLAMRIVFIFS